MGVEDQVGEEGRWRTWREEGVKGEGGKGGGGQGGGR